MNLAGRSIFDNEDHPSAFAGMTTDNSCESSSLSESLGNFGSEYWPSLQNQAVCPSSEDLRLAENLQGIHAISDGEHSDHSSKENSVTCDASDTTSDIGDGELYSTSEPSEMEAEENDLILSSSMSPPDVDRIMGIGEDEGSELKELPQQTSPKVLARYRLRSGQDLLVCFGDLTKENVDAIVNGTNTQMQHKGGLAGAIVKAGGQIIQDESNSIMQRRTDELNSSEMICTGSGKLPSRYVLHVAGPICQDGNRQDDILFDSITNVLSKANEMGLRSIAIPAICSGTCNLGMKLLVQTIIQATCMYFSTQLKKTSVSTIRFTDIDYETCKHFMDVLNATGLYKESYVHNDQGDATQDYEVLDTPIHSGGSVFRISSDTISTNEGKKTIKLKRGSIAREKVDVIINIVSGSMNLQKGAISAAILARAGAKLLQDFNFELQGRGLDHFQHIRTRPGNLRCRAVYHFYCPHYDKNNQQLLEKNLRSSLQEMFLEADSTGMTSIAVPAIGTGNLGFPPEVVAQLMYQAAIAFSKENPDGSLDDIRFIVYHKDHNLIKVFEDEMESLLRQKHKSTFSYASHMTSKPAAKSKSITNDKDKTYEDFQAESDSTCRIKIGSITVELAEGDILTADTDVIVNCTDTDFSLSGPLSAAILRMGGGTVQEECQRIGRDHLFKEGVIFTSAGMFQHTLKIAHIMTNRGVDTPSNLKDRIQKVLEMTEEHEMTSVAFPAVGTGDTNCWPPDVAKALFGAIGAFAASNPQHLLVVKVFIFQMPDLFQIYKHAMQSQEGQGYNLNARKTFEKVERRSTVVETEEAEEQPDTVLSHILAGSNHDITAADRTNNEFISAEFTKKEVLYDCGSLTFESQTRLQSIASRNQTLVEFLTGGNMKSSRLIIRGKVENVTTTYTEILHLLTKIQADEKQRIENDSINKQVKWKYENVFGQYIPYGEKINPVIESALRRKDPFIHLVLKDRKISIDFENNEEISSTGKKTKVYRADLVQEAIDRLPEHWDPYKRKDSKKISTCSPEYRDVADSFYHSFRTSSRRRQIIKIERIQNLELMKQYMAKKDAMERTLPPYCIERDLFHGTAGNNVKDINTQGFNRSFKGKNGTAYGNGTYFARDSKYSEYYACANADGNRYMYRCKVLTGKFTQGKKGMLVPPAKPHSSDEPYDSVVDNPDNPKIFVVFRDAHAYPEYLITFN